MGQRYIKLKLGDGETALNARGGWQVIKDTGVITSSSRVATNSCLGYQAHLSLPGNIALQGAWVKSAIERYTPERSHFTTNTGDIIDNISSGEIIWKKDDMRLRYGYGESRHYLRRHQFFADIPVASVKAGIQVYLTKAQDDYAAMPDNRRDFDRHANHFATDVAWKTGDVRTQWGIGHTRAEKKNGVGFYPRNMSRHSRGTFISMARANEDYMRNRETVLSGKIDYQLIPELTVGFTGNIAQFTWKDEQIRTGEISATAHWKPSHPSLRNLSVRGAVGPGWSYKNQGKTPVLKDGHYRHSQALNAEVVVDYRFNVF